MTATESRTRTNPPINDGWRLVYAAKRDRLGLSDAEVAQQVAEAVGVPEDEALDYLLHAPIDEIPADVACAIARAVGSDFEGVFCR